MKLEEAIRCSSTSATGPNKCTSLTYFYLKKKVFVILFSFFKQNLTDAAVINYVLCKEKVNFMTFILPNAKNVRF